MTYKLKYEKVIHLDHLSANTDKDRGLQGRLSQTMKISALLSNHIHTVDLTSVAVIVWIDYQFIHTSLG